MADISKIKLGSTSYDIKDAVARQMISGGLSFNIVWTQSDYSASDVPSASKLTTIPYGVKVYYDAGTQEAIGTLDAETGSGPQVGFYLIYRCDSGTPSTSSFDEYVVVGTSANYYWEKIGSTVLDLKGLVTGVTLNKQTSTVLGASTHFTNSESTVTETDGTTADVLKTVGATKSTLDTVSVSKNAIKSASLTGTKTFNTDAVKASYASSTETLEISAASTGTVGISTSGADTQEVVDGTSEVTVVTDVTSTTETVKKTLGTLTAAAQTITVDTNDNVDALNNSTSITVSQHN